jgi:hypothetical protein
VRGLKDVADHERELSWKRVPGPGLLATRLD